MNGVVAHVAGVPVEETLLMLGPALIVAGGMATARIRAGLRRPRRLPGQRRAGRPVPPR
jgi:hypothetical protein